LGDRPKREGAEEIDIYESRYNRFEAGIKTVPAQVVQDLDRVSPRRGGCYDMNTIATAICLQER